MWMTPKSVLRNVCIFLGIKEMLKKYKAVMSSKIGYFLLFFIKLLIFYFMLGSWHL